MYDLACGIDVPTGGPFRAEARGGVFEFCSQACLDRFRSNPEKYLQENPVIRLEDVWKTFVLGKVEVPVLRGLSMRVYSGEMVTLVGASGSGKSTAMNIIGTLDVPTKGKAFIAGQDVSEISESGLAELRSRKIGFIFQQFNLIPSLDALENVTLPKVLRGEGGPETEKRARELLKSVGLEARMKHKPMELSGGEQQRVAIARAFINDPEYILADEPTGNLDSATSARIIDLLVDLWQASRKTMVIVTHDPHVAGHAQRIMNMKDGQLVANGGVSETSVWKGDGHHARAAAARGHGQRGGREAD